jgi:hypothetical protein
MFPTCIIFIVGCIFFAWITYKSRQVSKTAAQEESKKSEEPFTPQEYLYTVQLGYLEDDDYSYENSPSFDDFQEEPFTPEECMSTDQIETLEGDEYKKSPYFDELLEEPHIPEGCVLRDQTGTVKSSSTSGQLHTTPGDIMDRFRKMKAKIVKSEVICGEHVAAVSTPLEQDEPNVNLEIPKQEGGVLEGEGKLEIESQIDESSGKLPKQTSILGDALLRRQGEPGLDSFSKKYDSVTAELKNETVKRAITKDTSQ